MRLRPTLPPLALAAIVWTCLLLGPFDARAQGPTLTVSPGSGVYTTNQRFDLVVVFKPAGLGIVQGSVTVDDADATAALQSCAVPGTVPGGISVRCPGLTGAVLGPGFHVFRITLDLSDGSTLTATAGWNVLAANGP